MMEAKGPESINMIKVRGHATSNMVREGKANAEDKQGNDKADQAASKGSKDEQRRLYAMTGFFAERHEAYRKFMGRVQTFLIAMQRAGKEAWENKEKESKPTQILEGRRKARKSRIATQLKYHEEGDTGTGGAGSSNDPPRMSVDTKRMHVNEIRMEYCINKTIYRQREQVRRFILQLEWATTDEGDGITWLELHTLHRLHGGAMAPEGKEAAHGLDTPTWSQDMKAFKAAVRWIASHSVSKEDEWRLQTSYSRQNRLTGLGITNKHAAIRGMPKLSDGQAKAISKTI